MQTIDWPALKKTFLQTLAGTVVLAALLAWYLWGLPAALASSLAAAYLLAGFWLTERLTGLFTRTRRASPIESIALVSGKLLWWGALLPLSHMVDRSSELPVALGMGAFLLALVAAVLAHYAQLGSGAAHEGKP